ncbi:MAG: nitrogen fixation protein NifZ, partial [Methylococcales bacterium]
MKVEDLSIGDVVYAANTICDFGSMQNDCKANVLAKAGCKGVITLIGHVQEQPERSVFLVRFEDETMNLGSPVGCWLDDLTVA